MHNKEGIVLFKVQSLPCYITKQKNNKSTKDIDFYVKICI